MLTRMIAFVLKQLQPSPQGFKEWARFNGLGFVRCSSEPGPMCSAALLQAIKFNRPGGSP